MATADTDQRLATLEAQQALFTDSLADMLQNCWVGFPSVEANLLALEPGMQLEPHPPTPESDAPEPPWEPDWLTTFNAQRAWPMEPQARDWTCSVCSLTWLLQATGIDPQANRYDVAMSIGYQGCVNEWNGLESTDCLIRVLASYGVRARMQWVDFNEAYAATVTAGLLSGSGWYHWVGLRGKSGHDLWIANSARGYRGIYDTLSRAEFESSLGPFKLVYVVP
jgi:hypothetical protein